MLAHRTLGLVLGTCVMLAACSGSAGPTSSQTGPPASEPTHASPAGPSSPSPTPEPIPEVCADPCAVGILSVAFHPTTRLVRVGTTVTWKNMDPTAHTVTFLNGQIDSLDLAPGAGFSHTFDAVGTFAYHCKIHLDMLARIIVTP